MGAGVRRGAERVEGQGMDREGTSAANRGRQQVRLAGEISKTSSSGWVWSSGQLETAGEWGTGVQIGAGWALVQRGCRRGSQGSPGARG